MIYPGKVDRFNVIKRELKPNKLMSFQPGSCVVFVFDTDVEDTNILRKNISLVESMCSQVKLLTVMQVLTFEVEIEYATDVKHAQELTQTATISDFKSAVNKMKDIEFRNALKRHKLDMIKLWAKKMPTVVQSFQQESGRIKTND